MPVREPRNDHEMRTWIAWIIVGLVTVAAALVVVSMRSHPTATPRPHAGLSLPATAEWDPARLQCAAVGRRDSWGERWPDLVAVRITMRDTDVLGYTGDMGRGRTSSGRRRPLHALHLDVHQRPASARADAARGRAD